MIDYLKSFIVKFNLNLEKALEKNVNQCDADIYQVKHFNQFWSVSQEW